MQISCDNWMCRKAIEKHEKVENIVKKSFKNNQ